MSNDVTTRDNGAKLPTQVANPFAQSPVVAQPVGGGAGLTAVNARELAEIHGQIQLARANPRNQVKAMDAILNAFAREGLADSGLYEYSRGGSKISGLSIHAANALAQQWGNIRTGVKELSRGLGGSEVQAYAWDLETGFYTERTFHVRHWRDTQQGGYALKDERDIYETIANMGSRRQRACILAAIPDDVKEAAERQIHTTMRTKIDVTTETIKAMVKYFADEFKVTQAMIETRIQRRVDAISPAQMLQLKRIVQSLKDGMGEPADFFDMSIAEPSKDQAAAAASDNVGTGGGTASAATGSQTQAVKDQLRKANEPAGGDLGGYVPIYDEKSAIAKIREQDTAEKVQAVYDTVARDFELSKRKMPVSIDATKDDRLVTLQQQAERGDGKGDKKK